MISDLHHDSETTIYDAPCLCIPYISGLTTPANTFPDNSVTNGTCIYIHLTSYNSPSTEQLSEITTLPIITEKGLAWGGQLVGYGAKVLPKLVMEGHIDTPCVQLGEYYVPQVIDTSGVRYMYTEVIAMMFEGRANRQDFNGSWARLDPLWFRDPYGRVYNAPRILDFTASYMEAVPQRTQFTMTLKV